MKVRLLLFSARAFAMKFQPIIFVLCFYCNLLKADITSDLRQETVSLSTARNVYLTEPPIPKECTKLLDAFADYATDFTKCSIKHARPIKLCEKCIDHYVNFIAKYEQLSTTEINGTTCKSIYFSNDRLDVVLEYFDSILYVWEKGNCNACFTWNGTIPTISNTTQTFNKKYNETKKCIDENHPKADENNTEVCKKCMQSYLQLDDYYKSLSSDKIGVDSICMDIVDSMNATRSKWSKGLGCCKLRKSPEIIFLACSGLISFLPFLYYLILRYAGPIRELPNAMKQSRYKQRLLRTRSGSIN